MSLSEQLSKMREQSASRIPSDVLATVRQAVQDLSASGIAQRSVAEGAQAPAFSLPNAKGETVALADLLAKGPVVVSFYRGGWCPYCNLELKALQERLPEIADLGASLVVISPETPDNSLTTAEKNALEFEVLSDAGNAVARGFGLVFKLAEELKPIYERIGIDIVKQNGDDSYELPIPATYVIDRDGTVRKAFVDPDYTQRLDPDEIIDSLRRTKDG